MPAEPYLTQATPDEISAILKQNSSEWAGALAIEAYTRREAHLSAQDLTRDGGLTSWVLVRDQASPDGKSSREILASCETIRKRALVARNGSVEECICHGVCSVFCAPSQRGHGYASSMIRHLTSALESWQTSSPTANTEKGDQSKVVFGILFSDIGKQFYARHGWSVFPSSHVSLHPWPGSGSTRASLPVAQPLHASDLPSLCEQDEKLMRARLERVASSDKKAQIVGVVPDLRTTKWHHAREEFVANELFGQTPEIKGALVTLSTGKRVWCYWTRVFEKAEPEMSEKNVLIVLRLVVEGEDYDDSEPASEEGVEKETGSEVANAVASLLTGAQSEAGRWHMGSVQMWNPTSAVLAGARVLDHNAKVEHREEDSIASLKWYGDSDPASVRWISNEKYGWC